MDDQLKQVLDLFSQPAFLVKDDEVIWRNSSAAPLLAEGTPLPMLLEGDGALYSMWNRTGTLSIALILDNHYYDATVQITGGCELFVATKRSPEYQAGISAMINASAALRKPLHSLVNAADTVFDGMSQEQRAAFSQLNQSIYRLIRLSGQMSDGGRLLLHQKEAQKSPLELNNLIRNFLAQAQPLVESMGICLEFEPSSPISIDADSALLERALYNLLANSAAYTPKGGHIRIGLKKQNRTAFLVITDDGEGIPSQITASLFDRFSVSQSGDSRWGLGLGLPMVREIARLHGGSLMIGSNPDGKGTEAVISLSLERCAQNLRSFMVHYDYCGDFHHGLVELSDVLDAKSYDPEQVQ